MTETPWDTTSDNHRLPRIYRRLAELTCVMSLLLVAIMFVTARTSTRQFTVGRTWDKQELISISAVDHTGWNDLLKRRVDDRGGVDYAGWKASATDMQELSAYLDGMSRAAPERPASVESRLVFWINAYNALTIRGILREYPTSSIQQHADQSAYDIWRDLRLMVGGRPYSLGEIEHAVLRPMHEPRIHFALVCGARGCPRLRNEAYTPESLENQLQDNTREFFARPGNAALDAGGKSLTVSPLLEWYADDFGKNDQDRLRLVSPYLPKANTPQPRPREIRLQYGTYDWSLNDRATSAPHAESDDSPGAPPDPAQ